MKKLIEPDFEILSFAVSDVITVSTAITEDPDDSIQDDCPNDMPWKPVIYLYPQRETACEVKLDYAGKFTCTYPAYNDGWRVTAQPDGTLIDEKGRSYYCLFWEGEDQQKYDLSKGFVVSGRDTAVFLEEKLKVLGLTAREANEFIIFWLPRMEQNPYNLITFQTEDYEKVAKLTVEPKPDSILRVFMAYKALQEPVAIEPQELKSFERTGFSVIEWGGTIVNY